MFHRQRKGPDAARLMNKLNRELSLDEKQKGDIQTILDSRKPDFAALKSDAQKSLEALRDKTDADIRKILRADQQSKFDVLMARWRARIRERDAAGASPR